MTLIGIVSKNMSFFLILFTLQQSFRLLSFSLSFCLQSFHLMSVIRCHFRTFRPETFHFQWLYPQPESLLWACYRFECGRGWAWMEVARKQELITWLKEKITVRQNLCRKNAGKLSVCRQNVYRQNETVSFLDKNFSIL